MTKLGEPEVVCASLSGCSQLALGLETQTRDCQAGKLPLYGLPSAIAARLIAGPQVRAAMPQHVRPAQDLGQQEIAVAQAQQRPRLHAALGRPEGFLQEPCKKTRARAGTVRNRSRGKPRSL